MVILIMNMMNEYESQLLFHLAAKAPSHLSGHGE